MESVLPLVITSGWASGINAYLVVLLSGLLGRFGNFDAIPAALQRTDVLVAAGAMFAIEFVADKIPFIDTLWDSVHTVIRPAIGATIGALIGGDASSLDQAFYAAIGGVSALASHTVKAGLRMAINTSPEPVTNIAASVAEDVAVASVITLAMSHPEIALVIALVLLALGITLVVTLVRRIRRFLSRRRVPRTADGPRPRSKAPPH